MNRPRALRPGDHIRVVTPASGLTREQVARATQVLENEGYRVTFAEHAFAMTGFLAGPDEDRAADLMEAFLDPEVDAVVCSRGGYGCARLFPYLDLDAIAASGKLFAGFSDITTLHLALNQRGLPTLHAPMLLTLGSDREPWVWESFLGQLKGDVSTPATAPRGVTKVGGTAEGVVTGGCMILICDAIGTPNAMAARGKIVLLEDVDEQPHRIDAMLTHLLNTNSLDGAAGIVVGEMTRTDDRIDPKIGGTPWREMVMERLGPLEIPMIFDYPMGHAAQMLTLPLGIRARLDADAGTLTYLEPLCAVAS